MASTKFGDILRKTLVIGGAIYAASVPLGAGIVWLASHFGLLNGVDKIGTLGALANASLVTGFMVLASVTVLGWVFITALSDDVAFFPFVWTAWLAHYGLSTQIYAPFTIRMTAHGPFWRAPRSFYVSCLILSLVLLIVQVIDVLSNKEEKDSHPFRIVCVAIWTLLYGLTMTGSTWHWVRLDTVSSFRAVPIEQISLFGWLCTAVGASIYGAGFIWFMSWRTKGEWNRKLQEELD